MQKLGRREVLARGAGVAALAVVGAAGVAAAEPSPSTEELVRAFTRKLAAERPSLSEWIERKRAVAILRGLLGTEPEPWTQFELEAMAEIERNRLARRIGLRGRRLRPAPFLR